jgi:hypothetical protein
MKLSERCTERRVDASSTTRILVGAMTALSLGLPSGCTTSERPIYLSLLPGDAIEVNRVVGLPWEQTSFKVNRAYPSFAFDSTSIAGWLQSGWSKCVTAPAWESFVDASVTPPQLIHQQIVLLRKEPMAVMLMGRYSELAVTGGGAQPPSAGSQSGTLLFYASLSVQDVGRLVGDLRLLC